MVERKTRNTELEATEPLRGGGVLTALEYPSDHIPQWCHVHFWHVIWQNCWGRLRRKERKHCLDSTPTHSSVSPGRGSARKPEQAGGYRSLVTQVPLVMWAWYWWGFVCKAVLSQNVVPKHKPTTPSGAHPKKVVFLMLEEKKAGCYKELLGGLDCIEIPVSLYWCCLQALMWKKSPGTRAQ